MWRCLLGISEFGAWEWMKNDKRRGHKDLTFQKIHRTERAMGRLRGEY